MIPDKVQGIINTALCEYDRAYSGFAVGEDVSAAVAEAKEWIKAQLAAQPAEEWQPVEDERIECMHGDCGAYMKIRPNGDGLLIHNRERNGVDAAIALPDELRLCRRVQS